MLLPAAVYWGRGMVKTISVTLLLMLLIPCRAGADSQHGTKSEAIAMVHEIQKMFEKEGMEATLKAISDKSFKAFHDKDLYPFVYDFSGECVAHGGFPALVGKNLFDIKDMNGVYKTREMIKVAHDPGHGWVNYQWPNPINDKIENKTSYIERLGDKYLVG